MGENVMPAVDLDGRGDAELMCIAAVANLLGKRLTAVEKAAKSILVDRMSSGKGNEGHASVNGVEIAELTRKKGGDRSSYKVSNPEAYAAWLDAHDMDDYLREAILPTDDATKADFLIPLVEKTLKGELPDGVSPVAPAAPSVAVRLNPEAYAVLDSPQGVRDMMGVLEDEPSESEETRGIDSAFAALGL